MPHTTSAQLTLLRPGAVAAEVTDPSIQFIVRNGWSAATTRQYAAAISKFLIFITTVNTEGFVLPATSKNVYHFILWCAKTSGSTLSSTTIKRYLTGLRMWHVLHDKAFPEVNSHRVRLLLKSCSKTEVKRSRLTRVGLHLRDVVDLTDRLTSDNDSDLVMKAIILTGFWGLARLGELTYHPDHPAVFLRRQDVSFSNDGRSAKLSLRQAKSAAPGEIQFIRLRSQPNRLDPINVIHEVLTRFPGKAHDPLFPSSVRSVPMGKGRLVTFLKSNGPQDGNLWGGHSLRIGGASFQSHAGRPVSSLKRLGRWKSSAYKLYVHKYCSRVSRETTAMAALLHY